MKLSKTQIDKLMSIDISQTKPHFNQRRDELANVRLNFYLTPSMKAKVAERARAEKISMNEVTNLALEFYFASI